MTNIISFGKHLLKKNSKLITVISPIFNYVFGRNHFKIRGKGNKLEIKHSFFKKTLINIIGNNNKIVLGEKCLLIDTVITIKGDNNYINLGDMVIINKGDLYIEDNNGCLNIGDNTSIFGLTHLACIEGKKISIGKDCLLSSDVVFRVGDSHSILDMSGNRINPSEDIFVGDHVWLGNKTTLTKGAIVANNSIIGTGAIVTRKFTQPNVIIAGIPACIIKDNVNWDKKRI